MTPKPDFSVNGEIVEEGLAKPIFVNVAVHQNHVHVILEQRDGSTCHFRLRHDVWTTLNHSVLEHRADKFKPLK